MRNRIFTLLLGLVCVSAIPLPGLAQDPSHPFQLRSSTFDNNTFLPISAIHNITRYGGSKVGRRVDCTSTASPSCAP
jgi:hypothetical protein